MLDVSRKCCEYLVVFYLILLMIINLFINYFRTLRNIVDLRTERRKHRS